MQLSGEASSVYRFGVFELEGRSGELRRDGLKLKLQDQPCQVLVKLLDHAGEIVGREELRSVLWSDDTFVDFETGLNTTIKRLRETLGDSADNPTFIETVPRRGYRFIAPVSKPVPANLPAAQPVPVAQQGNRMKTGLRLAFVVALAGILVGFSLKHMSMGVGPSEKPLSFTPLTNDGQAKSGPLLTDGSRIYFSEILPSGRVLAQISTTGGETTLVPTSMKNPRLADISPDRTELLVLSAKAPMAKDELEGIELWIVPVAGGSARPVGTVLARDAIWGTDGETILYGEGHDIFIVNKDGSGQRKFLTVSGYPAYFRWSPDRKQLRFTMTDRPMTLQNALWEVGADGRALRLLSPGPAGPSVCCGSWTSNSEDFVFQSSSSGRTDLWKLPGERGIFHPHPVPVRLTAGPMNFSQAAASREPNEVFAIGSLPRAELVKYEQKSGKFEPYLSGVSAEGVDSSRDGRWVAYTSFPEGTLWRCRPDGGERLQLTFAPMRALLPRWSPDGQQIAFIGNTRGDNWTDYVISANGGIAAPLLADNDESADPTWTPDGKAIVFGPWKGTEGRGVRLLNLSTKEVSEVPGGKEFWSPRMSPDGRYIAAMTWNGSRMMLFDSTTKKWEEVANLYSGYPSWSQNGKFLYFQDWTGGAGFPSRIVRVRVSDYRLETVLDLRQIDRLAIGSFVTWSGLAPDGSVLLARDISAQEVYLLKW